MPLPEYGEVLSPTSNIANASLALLTEYGDFIHFHNVYENMRGASKEPAPSRDLGPITEGEIEDAQDFEYVAGQITINAIVQKYANMTIDDYYDRFVKQLELVRPLFANMIMAVMDAVPAGTVITASAEDMKNPEHYVTISPENGLEEFSHYDPAYSTPRTIYNPRIDHQRQLGALDIAVMVPHVCAAAQQILA